MSKICKLSQKTKVCLLFGMSVLFFAFIMYCAPMASDDYEFFSLDFSGASEIVNYVLYYGNGRVLGNLGAICLTQNPVLSVLVKALLISGIIFLVPAILDVRNPNGYLLSFLLFVTIPAKLFGEVYTWTSGFQNYLPPVWTTLMILFLLEKYDGLFTWWARGLSGAAIFLLGVAGQFYVEHCSLINIILAGCLVVYRHKTGRKIKPAVAWLVTAVIGFAFMMLIPKIFYIEGSRAGAYRSVNVDGIVRLVVSCVCAFAEIGAAFPPLGVMIMSGFAAVTTHMTRESRGKKWNSFLYCASLIVAVYAALNEFMLHNAWYGGLATVRNGITATVYLMAFLLWVAALYPLQDRELRGKIYFMLGVGILALAPLLIVSPTAGRLVFFTYVCAVMAILLFARYLARMAEDRVVVWIKRSMRYSAAVLLVLLCIIFCGISWMDSIRETHIHERMAAGDTRIVVFRIPYEYVFWDGPWCFGRAFYYEQWDDICFEPMEFTDWYRDYWQN